MAHALHENRLMRALFLILTLSAACGNSQEDIQAEIDRANHCTQASECADAGGYCPFGCNIFVNAAEKDRIRDLMRSYGSNCAYDCAQLKSVACESGRCVAKY
jgi:hypothetical protein